MRKTLHGIAHEKSYAVLHFAHFDSLVCIVARSQEKSLSRLQVYPENHILEPKITTLSCIQQKL